MNIIENFKKLITVRKSLLHNRNIGKYAIVRSRNEGVNAGIIVDADETGVVVKDARRLWRHKPKDISMSWYEGVSVSGVSKDSRISNPVLEKTIIEDYSITLCTDVAEKSIREAVTNEQS